MCGCSIWGPDRYANVTAISYYIHVNKTLETHEISHTNYL